MRHKSEVARRSSSDLPRYRPYADLAKLVTNLGADERTNFDARAFRGNSNPGFEELCVIVRRLRETHVSSTTKHRNFDFVIECIGDRCGGIVLTRISALNCWLLGPFPHKLRSLCRVADNHALLKITQSHSGRSRCIARRNPSVSALLRTRRAVAKMRSAASGEQRPFAFQQKPAKSQATSEREVFILGALRLPTRGTLTRFRGQRYGLEAHQRRRGPVR